MQQGPYGDTRWSLGAGGAHAPEIKSNHGLHDANENKIIAKRQLG